MFILAGVAGFSGVALGAFGAHALSAKLEELGHSGTWATAVDYHLLHAVGLLALGLWQRAAHENPWVSRIFGCWLGGVILFSGSLYGLSLGGPGILGPVTPLGGLLFLCGWAMLIPAAYREGREV